MFELMKAKSEARKVRGETINTIEQFIRNQTVSLLKISDIDERKAAEDEIAKMAAIKEVLKKKQEPSKLVCILAEGGVKVGGIILTLFLKERMMNAGTGDKIISNGLDQIIKS